MDGLSRPVSPFTKISDTFGGSRQKFSTKLPLDVAKQPHICKVCQSLTRPWNCVASEKYSLEVVPSLKQAFIPQFLRAIVPVIGIDEYGISTRHF